MQGETTASAKRLLGDLGLTPVSSQTLAGNLWMLGPMHAAALDTWKKRCEQYAEIGLTKLYCPSTTNTRVTADDMKGTPQAIRDAAEIAKQFNITGMIEYARTSTHLASLRTSVDMIREANHPNVRPMLDFFHTWAGYTKFEDLDMLRPGELAHVHFQDILDTP